MSKYMKKFIATFIALTFIFNLTQPILGYAQSLEENNFQKEYERELRPKSFELLETRKAI